MHRYLTLAARFILGFCFVIYGANGLLTLISGKGFMPMPPPSHSMMEVMTGFYKAQYLMPLVKVLELVAGALLILDIHKRLALTLLAPIVVNILGIHLFVDPAALPVSIVLLGLMAWLIRSEWKDGFAALMAR